MILPKVECIFRHCYDESTYFNIKRTADVNVRGFKYGNFGFLFPKKKPFKALTLIHGPKGVITTLVKTCESSSQ